MRSRNSRAAVGGAGDRDRGTRSEECSTRRTGHRDAQCSRPIEPVRASRGRPGPRDPERPVCEANEDSEPAPGAPRLRDSLGRSAGPGNGESSTRRIARREPHRRAPGIRGLGNAANAQGRWTKGGEVEGVRTPEEFQVPAEFPAPRVSTLLRSKKKPSGAEERRRVRFTADTSLYRPCPGQGDSG